MPVPMLYVLGIEANVAAIVLEELRNKISFLLKETNFSWLLVDFDCNYSVSFAISISDCQEIRRKSQPDIAPKEKAATNLIVSNPPADWRIHRMERHFPKTSRCCSSVSMM